MIDVLDVGVTSSVANSYLDTIAQQEQGEKRQCHDFVVFSRHLQNHPELASKKVVRIDMGSDGEFSETLIVANETGRPFEDVVGMLDPMREVHA